MLRVIDSTPQEIRSNLPLLRVNSSFPSIIRLPNFFSKTEVNLILNYAIDILHSSQDFTYKNLEKTSFSTRRDMRPSGQNVKGISQNIFICPSHSMGKNLYKLYLKAAFLRYKCLPSELHDNLNSFDELHNINGLGYPILDIRHYPELYGHLDLHTDPPSQQGFVAMVILQKSNCKSEALYLENTSGKYFVDHYLNPGDAYIFSPDTPHGVSSKPNEPTSNYSSKIKWESYFGRWAVFCPWLRPN